MRDCFPHQLLMPAKDRQRHRRIAHRGQKPACKRMRDRPRHLQPPPFNLACLHHIAMGQTGDGPCDFRAVAAQAHPIRSSAGEKPDLCAVGELVQKIGVAFGRSGLEGGVGHLRYLLRRNLINYGSKGRKADLRECMMEAATCIWKRSLVRCSGTGHRSAKFPAESEHSPAVKSVCIAIAINDLGAFGEVAPKLGGCREIGQTPSKTHDRQPAHLQVRYNFAQVGQFEKQRFRCSP